MVKSPDPSTPKENATFLEFSLCLSRACLGKMVVFAFAKMAQKRRFFTINLLYLLRSGVISGDQRNETEADAARDLQRLPLRLYFNRSPINPE